MLKSGAVTVNVLEAVLPVPPFVEDTLPVVLFLVPAVVGVTLTETVHEPDARIVPLEKLRLVSPAPGAKVGEPHPDRFTFGVAATCRPTGRLSVNTTPMRDVPAFGFVMVKLRVLVPSTLTVFGVKDLAIEGGIRMVTVSEPVLFESFISVTLLFGSIVAIFARLALEAGVTAKVTATLPAVPIVTVPPFAAQLSVPVVMLQLILADPVTLVKEPAAGAP